MIDDKGLAAIAALFCAYLSTVALEILLGWFEKWFFGEEE